MKRVESACNNRCNEDEFDNMQTGKLCPGEIVLPLHAVSPLALSSRVMAAYKTYRWRIQASTV